MPHDRIGANALLSLALLAATSACANHVDTVVQTPVATPRDWRTVATDSDRERLRDWRSSFSTALARARAAGHGATLDAGGALFRPDAALPGLPLANGQYRCRVVKLGAQSPGMLDYVDYPWFTCRVRQEQGLQGFAKLSGSQRPVGLLFPDGTMRQLFLGTLVLGDEVSARRYGEDTDRDMAGILERIGDNRWRLLLPAPRFESLMDVIEIVPAADGE